MLYKSCCIALYCIFFSPRGEKKYDNQAEVTALAIPQLLLNKYKLTIKEEDMLASCTSALVQLTFCENDFLHTVREEYRSAANTRRVPIPGPYMW